MIIRIRLACIFYLLINVLSAQNCDALYEQIKLDYQDSNLNIKELDSVIDLCPDIKRYSKLYYYRGLNAFDNENFALGIYELTRVLEYADGYLYQYEVLNNLGILYVLQGDYVNSKKYFKKSYDLAISNEDPDKADYSYESLLALELDNGNADYLKKYEEYFINKDFKGDQCGQLHTLSFLAEFYFVFKEFDKANDLIEEYFLIDENYDNCALDVISLYGLRAKLALQNDNYNRGIAILNDIPYGSIELLDRVPTYKIYKELYTELGNEEYASIYADSIVATLEENRKNNNKANFKVLSKASENATSFEDIISNLWLYVIIALVVFLISIGVIIYLNKSKQEIDEKGVFYKDNYNNLWSSYQLSNKKLEILKKELILIKSSDNKSEYINILNDINVHLDRNADDPHKHINMSENSFIQALKKKAPFLNDKELNVCFFFKLNLSHKKIAEILGKSEKSIDSYKYRINKKVHLNKQIELKDFFKSIDYQ